ncbi:MAG TPA: FHA domain-containing protein [Kofleriaceae bacterium]|nr:FHA domain-containing protein [Kofleriaceae bacterium]
MRCSVCGHESPPGSSFCLNCGSALAAVAQTPALPGGLPVICPSCRGENPAGMKFCRSCGAALLQVVPQVGAPMMAPAIPPKLSPAAAALPATAPGLIPPGGPAPLPPPPAAPRVAQGSTINCPRCGTATPLGFAYCQQCGLHLQAIAPTDPGAARARSPSSAPPVVVAAQGMVDAQAATIAQPDTGRQKPPPAAAPAARPSSASAWGAAILVNRDGSDGQRYPLASEDTVIGRAGADIAFDDDRFLARQHARISRTADGNVAVHPIDTINGVYKKADAPVEVSDGALILVGREVLRFERLSPDEKTVHPLVRYGVALFGSPPRDPWGRLLQLLPSGGYRDVRHLIGEEIVLGREEGDIVFRDDAFMSRRHAALTWDGKRVMLTDLGSSNGTFIRVSGPTPIKSGDHVRMGDQLLRIER